MKKLAVVIGFVLLIALIAGIGWLLVTTKALAITTVTCKVESTVCPPRVAEYVEQQLLGKPLTITDFSLAMPTSEYQVIDFEKKLPGNLLVLVKPSNPHQVVGNVETDDQQALTDSIAETLNAQDIAYSGIEVKTDQAMVVVYLPPGQALLSLEHLNQDLAKLILVQKHLKLAEIDTAIVEIDLRYQMPVLRTTKSF